MFKLNIKRNSPVLIVFMLGLILRLVAINQSLWLDEAISAELVKTPQFLSKIIDLMKGDYNPPLFNFILYFWLKVFPANELWIRMPSLIFGLLTGIYLYKLAMLIIGTKKEVLLSLFLLMTSPLHIYYSQEARMYSLAAFTTTASMYYFLKFLHNNNFLNTKYYILYTILMLYSHYLCWLILPVQWLYLVLTKFWQDKKLSLNILISNILIFLSIFPLLPLLFSQLTIGEHTAKSNLVWGEVVGSFSAKNIMLLPVKFIIGRTSFDNKNVYYFVVAILIMFFLAVLWRAKTTKRLIWLWLIMPPVLGAVISLKIPVFSYFRFLFCLPALYLLVTRGVFSFKKPAPYIFCLLFINLFFSFRYLFCQDYHRENWKEAVKILHLENPQRAPVLIIENVTAPFNFYDKGQSYLVYFDQKQQIVNADTVWILPYSQPIFDPKDETRSFLAKNGFVRTFEQHFRTVTLEKWQKAFAFRYN